MLPSAGGAALGLAFGWWMGGGRGAVRKIVTTSLGIAIATAVLASEVAFVAGIPSVLYFLGAAAVSLWLHLAWREGLRRRFGPIDPSKEFAL